jgi:heme/copper-type cytochrome/quinol oxidase subunit 3
VSVATALPAGAPAVPRRHLLALAVLVAGASAMVMGSMLAVWLQFRANAPLRESTSGLRMIRDWLPADVAIPEVVTNTMMITFVLLCVMVQWAVHAGRRGDSRHASLALSVALLVEVAIINAQFAVWSQMGIGVRDGAFMTMFYAVTGTMLALVVLGTCATLATLFRTLAGRIGDRGLLAAHALHWYALAAIFATMWFVVYVQK